MIDSVSIVIQGPLRDPKIKFAIQDYLKTGYEVIVSCSSSCDITMLGDAKDQVTLVRTINQKLSGYAGSIDHVPFPEAMLYQKPVLGSVHNLALHPSPACTFP